MFRVERRAEASTWHSLLAPVAAVGAALGAGALLFVLLHKDPAQGLELMWIEPLRTMRALGELAVKTTPLLLIAVGLCVSFRAGLWNIGAEGQFVLGAICGGGLAMRAPEAGGGWIVVPILLAGVLGGMFWAATVAAFRDRFGASEILVSLMLVYVAELLLGYLVFGPWRDPLGYNFPHTIAFPESTRIPRLAAGSRADIGVLLALGAAIASWVFLLRSYGGFQLRVSGVAPAAARYAGFSGRRAIWTALLVSGATAGLAGALEACGPVGQLNPYVPQGYGFTAIIVAFLGRLHPIGSVLSAVIMSMLTIGGELCQSRLGLPKAISGVFQGLVLLILLASDGMARYRITWTAAATTGS